MKPLPMTMTTTKRQGGRGWQLTISAMVAALLAAEAVLLGDRGAQQQLSQHAEDVKDLMEANGC